MAFKLTCLRFPKGASGKDVEAFRGLGSLIVLGGSVGGVTYPSTMSSVFANGNVASL